MAVNIDTRHFPIVREARAVGEIAAARSGGLMVRTDAVRTVMTGLIALVLFVGLFVLLFNHIEIPTALWGLAASVGVFYFADPRTYASSLVTAIRDGLSEQSGPGGQTTTITTTPTESKGGDGH